MNKSKPAASITVAKVVEFISKIMYRFSVPNNIIIDNELSLLRGISETSVMMHESWLITPQSRKHKAADKLNGLTV
jgi:hypothetical protein